MKLDESGGGEAAAGEQQAARAGAAMRGCGTPAGKVLLPVIIGSEQIVPLCHRVDEDRSNVQRDGGQ